MKSPSQSLTRKPSTSVKNFTAAWWSGECSTMWLMRTGMPSQRAIVALRAARHVAGDLERQAVGREEAEAIAAARRGERARRVDDLRQPAACTFAVQRIHVGARLSAASAITSMWLLSARPQAHHVGLVAALRARARPGRRVLGTSLQAPLLQRRSAFSASRSVDAIAHIADFGHSAHDGSLVLRFRWAARRANIAPGGLRLVHRRARAELAAADGDGLARTMYAQRSKRRAGSALKRRVDVGVPRQFLGQHEAVLDGHAGALAQVRRGGVRGIAEQHHAALDARGRPATAIPAAGTPRRRRR